MKSSSQSRGLASRFSSRVLCLATVAAALLPGIASATPLTIDQQQTAHPDSGPSPSYNFGEVFTPTQNNVAGGGFFFTGDGNPVNLTISLWNGVPDGTQSLLATQSGSASIGDVGSFFDLFFASVISVTPGSQYFLSVGGADNNGSYRAWTTPNGANTGNMYWTDGNANGAYGYYPDRDLAFHEYATTVVRDPATPVTEPASLALLGIGLAGLAAAHRRKQSV